MTDDGRERVPTVRGLWRFIGQRRTVVLKIFEFARRVHVDQRYTLCYVSFVPRSNRVRSPFPSPTIVGCSTNNSVEPRLPRNRLVITSSIRARIASDRSSRWVAGTNVRQKKARRPVN